MYMGDRLHTQTADWRLLSQSSVMVSLFHPADPKHVDSGEDVHSTSVYQLHGAISITTTLHKQCFLLHIQLVTIAPQSSCFSEAHKFSAL